MAQIQRLAEEIILLEADVAARVASSTKAGNQSTRPVADAVSVVIIGGTGNLARKKIYPSLYRLMAGGFLPRGSTIIACVHISKLASLRAQLAFSIPCPSERFCGCGV